MMHDDRHMPYSRKGLEELAAALGVHSAYLWVNPATDRIDIKQVAHSQIRSEQVPDMEEEVE
jgi:hypothetical protein